jgi:hypothetical protein
VYDQITPEAAFKNYLKSAQEIKYFFIVMLWKKLWNEPAHRELLLRTLEFIKRGNYYSQIFIECLGDVDHTYLRLMVEHLNEILGELVTHYLNDPTEENHKHYSAQVELVCNMMKDLYLSNKAKRRLTIEDFNNKVIM